MLGQTISGLVTGSAYVLVGLCLVLSYRIGAVVNFSQTAVGALCAFLLTSLISSGMPTGVAIGVALLVGAAIAAVQGVVMATLFPNATIAVRTAVTIGMALSIFELITIVYSNVPRSFPAVLSGHAFAIGGVDVSQQDVLTIATMVCVAAGLLLLLGKTRLGVILRATASSPQTAEVLGVRVRLLVICVWASAGLVSTFASILLAPSRGDQQAQFLLVGPALAGAALGRLNSVVLTVVGGLAVGVLESWTLLFHGGLSYWGGSVVPAAFLTLVLLWMNRREVHGDVR